MRLISMVIVSSSKELDLDRSTVNVTYTVHWVLQVRHKTFEVMILIFDFKNK